MIFHFAFNESERFAWFPLLSALQNRCASKFQHSTAHGWAKNHSTLLSHHELSGFLPNLLLEASKFFLALLVLSAFACMQNVFAPNRTWKNISHARSPVSEGNSFSEQHWLIQKHRFWVLRGNCCHLNFQLYCSSLEEKHFVMQFWLCNIFELALSSSAIKWKIFVAKRRWIMRMMANSTAVASVNLKFLIIKRLRLDKFKKLTKSSRKSSLNGSIALSLVSCGESLNCSLRFSLSFWNFPLNWSQLWDIRQRILRNFLHKTDWNEIAFP